MSTQANPMRSVSIDEIRQYLDNAGLSVGAHDFDFAIDNGAFKYIGYYDGKHRFLCAFHDDDDAASFFVTTIFVYLGANGLICADFAGSYDFSSQDPEKVLAYIEQRCN